MEDRNNLSAISFVGRTLSPFFLYDPKLDASVMDAAYDALADIDPVEAAEAWPFADRAVAQQALELMGSHLSHQDLTTEYRRLFVGPGPKAAPPWGSVYTDRDQVFFGESTLDLRDWLRRHSIEVQKGRSDEPEDHIGLMLELMAWISDNRSELLDEYLSEHLLPWAPHMLEEMADNAQYPFFKGLADLTRSTLLGIQDCRELAVEIPHYYR